MALDRARIPLLAFKMHLSCRSYANQARGNFGRWNVRFGRSSLAQKNPIFSIFSSKPLARTKNGNGNEIQFNPGKARQHSKESMPKFPLPRCDETKLPQNGDGGAARKKAAPFVSVAVITIQSGRPFSNAISVPSLLSPPE